MAFCLRSQELCTISPLVFEEHDQLINILSQINQCLEKGGLSVQLGSGNKFGRIPMDQAIEETANRETKAPGGTKGFSARTSVVARYYLTPKYIRAYVSDMRNMIDDNKSSVDHPDLRRSEEI